MPTEYVGDDAAGDVLESAIIDYDLLTIDVISSISQDSSKMLGVVKFHVHEVELAIEAQRLVAALVQPLLSGGGLFEHDEGSTGLNAVPVSECAPSGKPIYKIEPELIATRNAAQPVEVGAKVLSQNRELGLAMLLNLRRGIARMPYEGHCPPPSR